MQQIYQVFQSYPEIIKFYPWILLGLLILLILVILASVKDSAKDKNSEEKLNKMLKETTAQTREKNEALKNELERRKSIEDELVSTKLKLETQSKKIETLTSKESQERKEVEKLKVDMVLKDKQLKDNSVIVDRDSSQISQLNESLKKKEEELTSLNEAYGGLKEQYDELERELSQRNQEKATKYESPEVANDAGRKEDISQNNQQVNPSSIPESSSEENKDKPNEA